MEKSAIIWSFRVFSFPIFRVKRWQVFYVGQWLLTSVLLTITYWTLTGSFDSTFFYSITKVKILGLPNVKTGTKCYITYNNLYKQEKGTMIIAVMWQRQ